MSQWPIVTMFVHPDRIAEGLYAVLDTEEKRYVAASSVKTFVISEAQRLNGFMPIDGGEQTYAQQIAETDGPTQFAPNDDAPSASRSSASLS